MTILSMFQYHMGEHIDAEHKLRRCSKSWSITLQIIFDSKQRFEIIDSHVLNHSAHFDLVLGVAGGENDAPGHLIEREHRFDQVEI